MKHVWEVLGLIGLVVVLSWLADPEAGKIVYNLIMVVAAIAVVSAVAIGVIGLGVAFVKKVVGK